MTVFIDVFVNGNSCFSLFCLADFCMQLHRQVYWEFVESNGLWLLFKSSLHLGQSTGAVGCQFLSYPLSDERTLPPQMNSMSVTCLSAVLGATCSRTVPACRAPEWAWPFSWWYPIQLLWMESGQWLWAPGWSVYETPACVPMSGKMAPSYKLQNTYCCLCGLSCVAAVWVGRTVSEFSLKEVSSWNPYHYTTKHPIAPAQHSGYEILVSHSSVSLHPSRVVVLNLPDAAMPL